MNGLVARSNFEKAVQIFYNAFVPRDRQGMITNPNFDPVSAFKLTQATLRLEQPLVTTNAQYTFPVLVNIQNGSQQQFNTEIRLNQQDSFVPTEVGIFVALPTGATDTTFRLLTYNSPAIFSAAAAAALPTLYNGLFKIMINNVQYLNYWDIWRHWYAGQTQQTAPLGAGSPEDQFCGADDGFYPMEPYVLLIGSQNIQINITLPAAISTVDANSRVIILFRGVLAQNSTVVS